MAADVPFVFDQNSLDVAGYTSDQIEQVHISSPDLAGVPTATQVAENDAFDFPITGGDNTPIGTTEKKVSSLKIEFDSRVEPENSRVNEEAVVIAAKYPGDHTIDQVCSIYSYLKNGADSKKGWSYVPDPRGIDYLRYANASLELGDRANCVGAGDCDDFAILMSALVASVGGTTRIILAHNNTTGGHAYAEVYLGRLNDSSDQVEEIIEWLQQEFDTDKIYGHIDTDTKEVWLNLDWGADEKGNAHPGGPLFQGGKHYVFRIRDKYKPIPYRIAETINWTPRLIGLTPDKSTPQEVGSVVTWIAKAVDRDNDRIYYRFLQDGYPVTRWTNNNSWVWTTAKADIGENRIEVYVRDGKHAGPNSFDSRNVTSFTITESKPAANETPATIAANATNAPASHQPSPPTSPPQTGVKQSHSKVVFPDPNLETAIRALINRSEGDIHISDLDRIKNFDASSKNIKDIAGLEHCRNLESLNLRDNQIVDAASLSGLTNLRKLYLCDNQIADVSPLSGLMKLTVLDLGNNQITDVSPLSELAKLTWLHLGNNYITDVSSLSNLTNLKELYLNGNRIADISPLSGLTNLTELYLDDNQIANVSPLSGLTNLEWLYLQGNQITDVSPLSSLNHLTNLYLIDNQITDVSPLSELTKLKELYLSGNQITNVSSLSQLTNLEWLYLYGNKIADVSPLSGLTKLTHLYLSNNQITDVSPLSGLTNLEWLYLYGNKIADVSPLSGLTNLTHLYLSNNQITDSSQLLNASHLMDQAE